MLAQQVVIQVAHKLRYQVSNEANTQITEDKKVGCQMEVHRPDSKIQKLLMSWKDGQHLISHLSFALKQARSL